MSREIAVTAMMLIWMVLIVMNEKNLDTCIRRTIFSSCVLVNAAFTAYLVYMYGH